MAREITEKQAQFVLKYLQNGRQATKAYRAAYPSAATWTDNAVRVEACRLLKNPAVQATLKNAKVDVATTRPHRLDELRAASVDMVRTGAIEPAEAAPVSGDVLPPEQPTAQAERTRQAFAHSLAGCIADQEKAMAMAEAAGNAAAYSRAAEVKAKLLGHMIDRSEGRHLHAVVDPAAEQPDISSIWTRTTAAPTLPAPSSDQDAA